MALVTAAEVRAGGLRGLTGTAEDSVLNTLIQRVDGLMASYCGYPAQGGTAGAATLEDVTYTHYLDGPVRSRELRLPVSPVVSVTSIYDDPLMTYGSDELIDSSNYTLYGADGLVILTETANHSWNTARRTIKVTYVAGWESIPAALKHATILQTVHLFQHRDTIGKSSLSKAGGSASVKSLELLPEVRQALAPFRLTNSWVG